MILCKMNRLYVSVGRAPRYLPGYVYFRSNDHGKGNEHNWSLVLGAIWLFVSLRPGGV